MPMELLPLSLTTGSFTSSSNSNSNNNRSSSRPGGGGSNNTESHSSSSGGRGTPAPNTNGGTTDKRIERRKPNWTEAENVLLLDQFSLHSELLTCKATDASTNLRKQEVWRIICQNLNRQNSLVRRTPAEVRRKWKNLVTAAKKEVWEIRHQVHLTGGAAVRRISELSQRVLQLHSSGGESSSSSAAAAAAAAASLFLNAAAHNHNGSSIGLGNDDYYDSKLDAIGPGSINSSIHSNGVGGLAGLGGFYGPIVQLNEHSTPSLGDEEDDDQDQCCYDDVDDGVGGLGGADDRDDDRSMMSSPSESIMINAPGSNEFDSGIYEEEAHDLRVNKGLQMNGHNNGSSNNNNNNNHGVVMNGKGGHHPPYTLHRSLSLGNGPGYQNNHQHNHTNNHKPGVGLAHLIRKTSESAAEEMQMQMQLLRRNALVTRNNSSSRSLSSSNNDDQQDLLRTKLELQIDVLKLRKKRMEIELRRLLKYPSATKCIGGGGFWWRKRYLRSVAAANNNNNNYLQVNRNLTAGAAAATMNGSIGDSATVAAGTGSNPDSNGATTPANNNNNAK